LTRLDEKLWVLGGGLTPEWRWVGKKRVDGVLAGVKAARARAASAAPAPVKKRRYGQGLAYFAAKSGPARDRLAEHPAIDYWLFLWDRHFAKLQARAQDWHMQLGQFQGLAASLALARRERAAFDGFLDPDGRLYLYGTRHYLEFPGRGLSPVTLETARGGGALRVTGPDGAALERPLASLPALVEVVPGIHVDDRGWLMTHGVTMHGLAKLEPEKQEEFAKSLRVALADMKERDPLLHAEMTDMLRALIPLENPMSFGSVSSSYVNLRGAICLSHSDDALLQAETLIHEYCHQKMNQLLAVDPVLLPGQSGQVFYSPWRKDARRLRGLLLGAHAFLNVAKYLARSLSRERYPEAQSIEVMVNVARRVYQVETALRSISLYASLTELGHRFVGFMWHETGRLHHAISWFPPALLEEQRKACDEHRREHSLFGTGFHKDAAFMDKVPRAAFLTPKSADEAAPA
jgi:HEXXH motif-containing protein